MEAATISTLIWMGMFIFIAIAMKLFSGWIDSQGGPFTPGYNELESEMQEADKEYEKEKQEYFDELDRLEDERIVCYPPLDPIQRQ